MLAAIKNANIHILVIGDMMIDHYLWGETNRISPEAPVQVVDVKEESRVLGGAGNVANNLRSLQAQVSVASVIGDDENGIELKTMLQEIGVSHTILVEQQGRKSSKKSRVIAANQQILRYDKESKEDISLDSVSMLIHDIEKKIEAFDAIILSDYAKGVITQELAQGVILLAKQHNKKVFVDPKGIDYSKYRGAYLLTPNKKEAVQATGITISSQQTLQEALLWLKHHCELSYAMITLSEDGIALFDKSLKTFKAAAKEVYDVTGAGDTVIASLAYAISAGATLEDAARFSNLAAGVAVGKIGSATVTFNEIFEYESSLHKSSSQEHIKSHHEIDAIVTRCKEQGKKIVFTNGCFDILHVGHVKYLQEAKSFGDVLIIGLNSDRSVKVLKGESRPINSEADRAYLLAALEAVDYVTIFDDETPLELIRMVEPDVLVKGGDYEGKEVVGTEFAQELRLVDFVQGKSTTTTIKRIQGQV